MADRPRIQHLPYNEQERLRLRRVHLRLRAIAFAGELVEYFNGHNDLHYERWENLVEAIENIILFTIEPELMHVHVQDLWYYPENQ